HRRDHGHRGPGLRGRPARPRGWRQDRRTLARPRRAGRRDRAGTAGRLPPYRAGDPVRLGGRAAAAIVLAALTVVSACGGHPPRPTAEPAKRTGPGKPSSGVRAVGNRALGRPGRYRVGERQVTFTEPARTGPTGQYLGPRTLVTEIRYPLAATGPFPLLVFGPGFMVCSGLYAQLLQTWASAGYV